MIELLKKTAITKDVNKFVPGIHFNPNFDGNALAWYDGNIDLDEAQWSDQGAGGHTILFTNTPTIVPGATPLRDAVRFDGINQFGTVATPATNQPFTVYCVLNQVTWGLSRRIIDDGVVLSANILYQTGVSPQIFIYSPGGNLAGNPNLALGTWGLMTAIYNGVSSEIRTNLNIAVTGGALGGASRSGMTIGSDTALGNNSNVEIAYLILRTGADSIAKQNKLINGLKVICGLTF